MNKFELLALDSSEIHVRFWFVGWGGRARQQKVHIEHRGEPHEAQGGGGDCEQWLRRGQGEELQVDERVTQGIHQKNRERGVVGSGGQSHGDGATT
jgi:hypothetical protein